ncbi:glucosaminidase domain-containing protein [Celerinatantimonas sp. YJH-8]|uniref:glucosaminidase domain-containing protein n=1 Tax=Celerinatantimonas sp. YJH-8 TaxID=3228714 RepID=UPI0038C7AE4B
MRWLVILSMLFVLVGCDNSPEMERWSLPRISVHKSHLPNLADTDTEQRKQRFTEYLLPLIRLANTQILKERKILLRAEQQFENKGSLSSRAEQFMEQLSDRYNVTFDGNVNEALFEQLKRRVDVIPPNLVLAQAANESAWGTSRFAQEGNNLFGQWCFKEGCGLVPQQRPDGATHEVQKFRSPYQSLAAYIRNLNTHPAYHQLRVIRQQQRLQKNQISGNALVEGLLYYSEKGQSYVDALKLLMLHNSDLWPDLVKLNLAE